MELKVWVGEFYWCLSADGEGIGLRCLVWGFEVGEGVLVWRIKLVNERVGGVVLELEAVKYRVNRLVKQKDEVRSG